MSPLQQYLSCFPRVQIAHTPTPLEILHNLSAGYSAVQLLVKRDDCTGLAMGGNKARQLEYYLGAAIDQGSDTILSTGATQSNYMRMLAAASAKFGLQCHILLESRVNKHDPDYLKSGNVLLDRLLGAQIHYYSHGVNEDGADNQVRIIADKLKKQGRKPYVIPLSGDHFPIGALGYVVAAAELIQQIQQQCIDVSVIVVGSGSGMTHAGLLFGLRLSGVNIPVLGVCVRRDMAQQTTRIFNHCRRLGEKCGQPNLISKDDIWLDDRMLAPGYGLASSKVINTIKQVATQEGLLLDPVYSGKTMACVLSRLKRGELDDNRQIIVWHTGGTPALFGYRKMFN